MHIFTPEDLTSLLSPSLVVEALRKGFADGAEVPVRHHHNIPVGSQSATLLIMPAWSISNEETASMGVKLVNVHPDNHKHGLPSIQGLYVLFDKQTGTPKAILDGATLTLFRTAAASVLAASYLVRPDSHKLLMVGTGRLAPYIVQAYHDVLGISEVRIWGRNAEKAVATSTQITAKGINAKASQDIKKAVQWADVISCATLSPRPLVLGEWLKPGHHLDLIGGFKPSMRETDDEAIRKASVFVDTREGAMSEAGDIIQPIQKGVIASQDIKADIHDLTVGNHLGRTFVEEITLFKSVGTALEDLVTAQLTYDLANGIK